MLNYYTNIVSQLIFDNQKYTIGWMGTVFRFYHVMSYQTSTSVAFIYQSGCQTPMASETFNYFNLLIITFYWSLWIASRVMIPLKMFTA